MVVDLIYESDSFIFVNKPYDMYINSDDESEKNTVTYHIASADSHLSTSSNPLRFVHRLDFATSGVLCIAKTKSAAAKAGIAFEKRKAKKYYLAIVRGHMSDEVLDIQYPIGSDALTAHSSHRMCALTTKLSTSSVIEQRDAHTRVLLLETGYYDGDPVSVLLLKPITGRRHQLRVHINAIGHPLLGDYTYSNARDSVPHRMYLHARRLLLPMPDKSLDIQTGEPFFTDARFTSKWKPKKDFYKYKNREDFIKVCDVIDKSYVLGAKYKIYCAT